MPKLKFKKKKFLSFLLNNKIFILIVNFFFQGMRYMSYGEKIFKLSITVSFAIIFYCISGDILISLILGHLANYLLNGQFFVLFRYLSDRPLMSKKKLSAYIYLLEKKIKTYQPLEVAIIGSFCRGKMSTNSDLDIRIYHKADVISSIKCYFMALTLRLHGLFIGFPVDVYCFSDLEFMRKIDVNEVPVNFLKNKDFLKLYPSSPTCEYQMEHLTVT